MGRTGRKVRRDGSRRDEFAVVNPPPALKMQIRGQALVLVDL